MLILTYGERLLILRRRKGLSQAARAAQLRMPLHKYRRLEQRTTRPKGAQPMRVRNVKPYELHRVRRRRAGLEVKELAEILGVSSWWVTQMERGAQDHAMLDEHWETEPASV